MRLDQPLSPHTGIRVPRVHGHKHYGQNHNCPIILFSPALGTSRLFYNAISEFIASAACCVVATIDHLYDMHIVEFLEGELIFDINISTVADGELAVRTRAQDASFVLEGLEQTSAAKHLLVGAIRAPGLKKAAIFGHSLGGAATAAAMVNDTRILGGANLDGTFFGPVVELGLDHPFLIFGRPGHNRSTDDSWAAIWSSLRGGRLSSG